MIVEKRQRRLNDVDAVAISLFAQGLTTGEMSAHFAEVYGRLDLQGHRQPDHQQGARAGSPLGRCRWSSRPLQSVYAAVFIDAIYVDSRRAGRTVLVA